MDRNEADSSPRCCDEYDEYLKRRWAARFSRRSFLQTTVGAMAAAPLMPSMAIRTALAQRVTSGSSTDPILVVVQLAGGNDGLNTVIPYSSGLYYQDRPTINVPTKNVIPLDGNVGLHPSLQSLKPLFDNKKLAIVQGVGYPNPDLSHFRSTQIWESADPVGDTATGWLGRYLDTHLSTDTNPLKAVAIGPMVPLSLVSDHSQVASIESVNTFRFLLSRGDSSVILKAYTAMNTGSPRGLPPYINLIRQAGQDAQEGVQDMQNIAMNYQPAVTYPQNQLSRELQLVAQMVSANLGTRIFHVTLGGFDDHAAEVYTHARLMQDLGDSVAAFYSDMEAHGKADQVLIMTFSEFGRRVKENAGRGTDHGTAAPLFVLGGQVKGGLYGDDPILGTLDNDGDLKYGIDFRSVYASVLDGWLGGDSRAVLTSSFDKIPFL